jgi:hypothetical protein
MTAETPPGWYADPMGRFDHRYWNGTTWTDHVSRGGAQSTDALSAPTVSEPTAPIPPVTETPVAQTQAAMPPVAETPVAVPTGTAPVRMCPHCRAQSTTAAPTCPTCGKNFRSSSKWPWVLVAVFVVMAVGFFGCVALVGTAADRAVDVADRTLRTLSEEQARHAITRSQFDAVELGTSRADVVDQLGRQPADSQDSLQPGLDGGEAISTGCIYYYRTGATFGGQYQFCFTDDRLESKNSF